MSSETSAPEISPQNRSPETDSRSGHLRQMELFGRALQTPNALKYCDETPIDPWRAMHLCLHVQKGLVDKDAIEELSDRINDLYRKVYDIGVKTIWGVYARPKVIDYYDDHLFEKLQRKDGETILTADADNPLDENELRQLKESGVDTVIISGCNDTACIPRTATYLVQNGFKVEIVLDCVVGEVDTHCVAPEIRFSYLDPFYRRAMVTCSPKLRHSEVESFPFVT